jgi:hypothetical protein
MYIYIFKIENNLLLKGVEWKEIKQESSRNMRPSPAGN